jgi:hypothetical protein
VFACGDKLLVIGRGLRFQRAYAGRQASLLIYSSGSQNEAVPGTKIASMLKQAGHRVQTAAGAAQLDTVLKSGKVDIILAEFADVGAIAPEVRSAPSNPVVLPILYRPSRAELAAAQKEYHVALKAPADEIRFLTAIDEALKLKLKSGAKS